LGCSFWPFLFFSAHSPGSLFFGLLCFFSRSLRSPAVLKWPIRPGLSLPSVDDTDRTPIPPDSFWGTFPHAQIFTMLVIVSKASRLLLPRFESAIPEVSQSLKSSPLFPILSSISLSGSRRNCLVGIFVFLSLPPPLFPPLFSRGLLKDQSTTKSNCSILQLGVSFYSVLSAHFQLISLFQGHPLLPPLHRL